jgi:hypothetical protein
VTYRLKGKVNIGALTIGQRPLIRLLPMIFRLHARPLYLFGSLGQGDGSFVTHVSLDVSSRPSRLWVDLGYTISGLEVVAFVEGFRHFPEHTDGDDAYDRREIDSK